MLLRYLNEDNKMFTGGYVVTMATPAENVDTCAFIFYSCTLHVVWCVSWSKLR